MKIYQELVSVLEGAPKIIKEPATLLDIAGYPHYENVVSNYLQYYFDFTEDHGLGDLLLRSLFGVLGKADEYVPPNYITVEREVSTGLGRIDLVINTEAYVIGIENKVFHHTKSNPFSEYQEHLERYDGKTYCVILSVFKDLPKRAKDLGFVNVTYEQLFEKVKSEFAAQLQNPVNFRAMFLIELMSSITKLTNENKMDKKVIDYITKNYDTLVDVKEVLDYFIESAEKKLNGLSKELKLDGMVKSMKIWKGKSQLRALQPVLFIRLKDIEEAKNLELKIRLSPQGWSIELWNISFLSDDKKQFLRNDNRHFERGNRNEEYVSYKEFDGYETPTKTVKNCVESLVAELYSA